MTQVKLYGQVASYTATPESSPSQHCKELINAFVQNGAHKSFSMQANIIGDVYQTNQKLDILERMQQLIEFDKLPANLEHPDMHLQIIYDVQTIPTRFVFGFREAS